MPLLLIQSKQSIKLLVAIILTMRGLFSAQMIILKDHNTQGRKVGTNDSRAAKKIFLTPYSLPVSPPCLSESCTCCLGWVWES